MNFTHSFELVSGVEKDLSVMLLIDFIYIRATIRVLRICTFDFKRQIKLREVSGKDIELLIDSC